MPILSAANKVPAVVAVVGQIKEGDYGPYRPVLLERRGWIRGSEEAKVWKSLKPEESGLLRKGQSVWLIPVVRKGIQTWDIEPIDDQVAAPVSAAPTKSAPHYEGLSDDKKKAIASHIDDMSRVYAYCLRQARKALSPAPVPEGQPEPESPTSEQIQACASSLFIAASRKFNL